MATKRITIHMAAYDRLKSHKRPDESFSEAIKRLLPEPLDIDALLRRLDRHPMSRSAMSAVEKQVANRRVTPAS